MHLDQSPSVKPPARGRIRAAVRSLRARAAAEDGVTLIEILVSAVILIIIITGVFRAFDAAGHITGFEQQRSQAQAIAQQDEDNLRALPVAQLDGLNKTYNTTVGKTTYKVVEQAQFQSEATGSSACSAHGSADVIKTTSTVSWAPNVTSGPTHVITASSIVSTPAGGALIVQILDANGNAVSGTSVTAVGPSGDPTPTSATLTSGPDGCAIFAGLAGGTYTVTAAQAGYVDPNGNSSASAQETVVEGTSVPTGFQLDRAGTVTGAFVATGTNAAGALYSFADTMTIANQGMAIPGTRIVGTLGTPFTPTSAPVGSVTNAFPFPSGYSVYAGSCIQNDPSTYTGNDDPSVPVNGTATQLGMPAIKVTVYSGTSKSNPGSASSGRVVTFYDSGCQVTRNATTNSSGYVDRRCSIRHLHDLHRQVGDHLPDSEPDQQHRRSHGMPLPRKRCADDPDRSMLMRRLVEVREADGEAGFTLVELLVTMIAGIVVLMATFGVLDLSMRQNARATDRVQTTPDRALGDGASDSGAPLSCAWATAPPVQVGSNGNTLWFISQFSSSTVPSPGAAQGHPERQRPQRYDLRAQRAGRDHRSARLAEQPGQLDVRQLQHHHATGYTNLITNVYPVGTATCLFQYYQYVNGQIAVDSTHLLSAPLTSTTAPAVGEVTIGMSVRPADQSTEADRAINLTDAAVVAAAPTNGASQCQ